MIDENKLIEDLKKSKTILVFEDSNPIDEGFNDGIDKAINLIKQQTKVCEWIAIEEELPEENEYVDITVLYKDEGIECQYDTDIARYYCQMWLDGHGMPIIGNVIAWKPRPEPYRKEDNK